MVDLKTNIDKLYSMMDRCSICPRKCGASRNNGKKGLCKTANKIFVASVNLHFGEEPPISAKNGSGTIFFSNCTLNCVFCQNYPISQLGNGKEITVENLSDSMLDFQKKGAHNVNLVTPTHYSAQIAKAVYIAKNNGLTVPIVYNCSGYEDIETLKLLEGIVDIYLSDIKYAYDEIAFKYSKVNNYVCASQLALKEMKRQVGNLQVDEHGVAKKGIIIRHLVLPNNLDNTKKVLKFLAQDLYKDTYISLMAQYHGAYKSNEFKELSNKLSLQEYNIALGYIKALNLKNGWIQNL